MTTETKFSTRLNSFALGKGKKLPTGNEDVLDLIKIAGTVEGLTSLEMNYPEHFHKASVEEIKAAMSDAGLTMEAIQLRWPSPDFSRGGFTNTDASVRAAAVQLVKEAVDVARQFGAGHVIMWPAHDGYEYPLQLNYVDAWKVLIESMKEVADYAGDLKISLEYKPAEPRGRTLLDSTGSVMYLIEQCGNANLGATLDFGHLLMAQESPAQSAGMALRQNKLHGVQLNDSFGAADDGLVVGTLHLPEMLEFVYYLRKYGYAGTYYFDTDPIRENPVQECEMNIRRMKQFIRIADELVVDLKDKTNDDALAVSEIIWNRLVAS